MNNNVVLKGYKDGILLVLNDSVSFEEILSSLEEKIRSSAKFLGNAHMSMKFEGRELSTEEQKEILRVISENSELDIICVIDGNETNETILKSSMEQAIGSLSNKSAQIFQGVLCSGRKLESENSIVIIGNVENGAEIVSGGSIVVIGDLRGTAVAGTNSSRDSFIFAAQMHPEKLSICKYTYIPEELSEKARKKESKELKKKHLDNCSMIARLFDESIQIHPVENDTFGADDELYELIY